MRTLFSALLFMGSAASAWTEPLIGFYDPTSYGDGYTAMMDLMAVPYQRLTPADLESAERLKPYRAVMVGYGYAAGSDRALPEKVQQALDAYVRGGGRLFCDYGAVPLFETAGIHWASSNHLAEFEIVDGDHPITAGLPLKKPLRYGRYSHLATAGEARVLARSGNYDQLVVHPHGAGLCVYSGMLLGGLNPGLGGSREIKTLLSNLIGFLADVPPRTFAVDPDELAAVVKAASPEEERPSEPRNRVIGVFAEPGFPASGMPADVTPASLLEWLRAHHDETRTLSAADLADPTVLTPREVGTLVMSYGETFPASALGNLTAYLSQGGGFLSPAGVPLSHPTVQRDGRWHDDGPCPAVVEALFDRVLPVRSFYRVHAPPVLAAVLEQQFFPRAPFFWPLSGGTVGFLPDHTDAEKKPFSRRVSVPVVVSGSSWGEPLATPVYYFGRQPQILLLGFEGHSHPWSPAAWGDYYPDGKALAERVFLDCVDLIRPRPEVALEDVRTDLPCYRAGEPVRVEVDLFGAAGEVAEAVVEVEIVGRDTGRRVAAARQTVTVRRGQTETVTFDFPPTRPPSPVPTTDWAYDVLVNAVCQGGDLQVRDRTMFTVWRPDVLKNGPRLSMLDEDLRIEGQSAWLAGVNLYLHDNRGLGLLFDTFSGDPRHHPLLDVMDDQLGVLGAMGMNHVRQSYFGARCGPDAPRDPASPPMRAVDAYLELTAVNRFIATLEPTQAMFNLPAWKELRDQVAGDDPDFYFAPGPFREACRRYYQDFIRRYPALPHVGWELINEPDSPDTDASEADRRHGQRLHREWVQFLAEGIREAAGDEAVLGTQNTAPTTSTAWDPKVVNEPLNFCALHDYAPPNHFARNRFHTGFALNYGYPAFVGESGTNAPEAQDRIWAYLFAEGALGYSHFYLYPPEGGSWALGRGDETEGATPKPVRLWLKVCEYRRRSDYEPPAVALLVNNYERFREPGLLDRAGEVYVDLLRQGIHAQVIVPRELNAWLERVNTIVVPAGMPFTPRVRTRLMAFAQATGKRVIALGEGDRPPGAQGPEALAQVVLARRSRCVEGEPEMTYERPHRDGGFTLVVLNERGPSRMVFRVGGGAAALAGAAPASRRVEFHVPQGYSALLDFGPAGELRLVKAFGPVAVDGAAVIEAPAEAAYVVVARDGRDLARSESLDILAFPPKGIRVHNPRADELTAWATEVTVRIPSDDYAPLARWLAEQLAARGWTCRVRKALFRDAAKIQITIQRDAVARVEPEPTLAARRNGFLPFLSLPEGRRLTQAWAGAIEVSDDGHTLTIRGATPGGLALAAQALTAVQTVQDYVTVPLAAVASGE